MIEPCTREDLLSHKAEHDTFVGIDSDGCVFDTMEIKQKQCFHPLIISHWGLEPIERAVRAAAEFVNLYSRGRGRNRFICLLETMDLLQDCPDVLAAGVALPDFSAARRWVDSCSTLGNPALEQAVRDTGDADLRHLLEWSYAVNERVEQVASSIGPFPFATEALERIAATSDAIVVSQTPSETLIREWTRNGIDAYVSLIAGQEVGTKSEHIDLATRDRYGSGRILMLGDAPGDLKAARDNDALFYPINPGHEIESWQRFCAEAYDKFLAQTYAGAYEEVRIREFEALLPELPPWKQ